MSVLGPGPRYKSGRRWTLCRATLAAHAFVGTVAAGLFVGSLFHDPRFPRIKIDDTELWRQDERNDQVGGEGTLVKTAYAENNDALPSIAAPRSSATGGRSSSGPPVIFVFLRSLG
jgi:hypothetical protein